MLSITNMANQHLKIVGVQYAANPEFRSGDTETDEMWQRTVSLLQNLDDNRPFVVLMAEPTNKVDPQAIMARADGNKIGYVSKDQRKKMSKILAKQKSGMMLAEITKVIVSKHGFLSIKVDCDEADTEEEDDVVEGVNLNEWNPDVPLLPPFEFEKAENEAVFVLEKMLLPQLDSIDIVTLKKYLDIWNEASKHDLSQEACVKRQQFIKKLEQAKRPEVRQLAEQQKHELTSMGCHQRVEDRARTWWPCVVNSEEADGIWDKWCQHIKGKLKEGLRCIDQILEKLPNALFLCINKIEVFFSKLYYLNIGREELGQVFSLLVLRQRTCAKLGIEMRAMTEADYEQLQPASSSFPVRDMEQALLSVSPQMALNCFGSMAAVFGHHPVWAQCSPTIHQHLLENSQKAECNKAAVQYHINNYKPEINTQQNNLPVPPQAPNSLPNE